MSQNKSINYKSLGLIKYEEALALQETYFKKTVDLKLRIRDDENLAHLQTENYILSCQHPHVYTLGKSGKESHLLISQNELLAIKAEYFATNRGGDITYHGPGQLVIYPILDLDNFFTDIHKYLRFLEEAVIQTLAEFGIKAGRVDGLTGVWIGENSSNPRKICAMGVRASRWVTMHGLALNVNTDLNYFSNIIPCGISDKEVTSMQKELGYLVDIEKVEEIFLEKSSEIFGWNIV